MAEHHQDDFDENDDFEDEDDDHDYDEDDDDFGDEDSEEEQEAEPWDLLSQALGSLDELESDEDLALDVSERGESTGGAERFAKVPLDQAANLIAVRQLAAGLQNGSLSVDAYRQRLRQMVRALEEGLKVVRSETVVTHIASLPEDQKVFFQQTEHLVDALVQGGHQMLGYCESKQWSDVEQGLQRIEQAFVDLDEMQSRAIELGREIEVRQAAMGD